MDELKQILTGLKEAKKRTTEQADKINSFTHLAAKEYFLGREAGLEYAIALIERYINSIELNK